MKFNPIMIKVAENNPRNPQKRKVFCQSLVNIFTELLNVRQKPTFWRIGSKTNGDAK